MVSLPNLTLALASLSTHYLCLLSARPPNPTPQTRAKDSVLTSATKPLLLGAQAYVVIGALLHAYLILFQSSKTSVVWEAAGSSKFSESWSPSMVCPHPERVPTLLLEWNWALALGMLIASLGAGLRVAAYSGLGRDFTFELARPERLVTGGLYRYMQHPSYTGALLMSLGAIPSILRPDGVWACFLPPELSALLVHGLFLAAPASALIVLGVRIKEEEALMKTSFGKEWEVWHGKTARFVPGIW